MGEGWLFLNLKWGYHGMSYCWKDTVQVLHEKLWNSAKCFINDFCYMRHLARFGTVCTILKREKHPWGSVSFSKVEACNSTKSNTPRFFFTFFKLYKWYQFAESKLSWNIWLVLQNQAITFRGLTDLGCFFSPIIVLVVWC